MGGFSTGKWAANHPALLTDIAEDKKANYVSLSTQSSFLCLSILGLSWNPNDDSFVFNNNVAASMSPYADLNIYTCRPHSPRPRLTEAI